MQSPTGMVLEVRRDRMPSRAVVLLKGCPLRCGWCQRPEAQHFRPEVWLSSEVCRTCGTCQTVCEPGRHQVQDGVHEMIAGAHCNACRMCTEHCPHDALQMLGQVLGASEVVSTLQALAAEQPLTEVLVGGGEPLYQHEFVADLLPRLRERGWRVVVRTAGWGPPQTFAALLPLCDELVIDLKETDPQLHQVWTGQPLEPLLANLRAACANGHQVTLRLPVVPLSNDREDHWHAVADLLGELPHPPPVRLVAYQPAGDEHRHSLGWSPGLIDGAPATRPARLASIGQLLTRRGVTVLD
ncbi:MAG: glycyl-radical enzyme activating protein [Fimbriimonadaceae bacterium]|nr:glycyl-radical enzyme activating protein [Fimbriimonadaceae bacterium]